MSLLVCDRLIRLDDVLGITFDKSQDNDYFVGRVIIIYRLGSSEKTTSYEFVFEKEIVYDKVKREVASIFVRPWVVYDFDETINLVVKSFELAGDDVKDEIYVKEAYRELFKKHKREPTAEELRNMIKFKLMTEPKPVG